MYQQVHNVFFFLINGIHATDHIKENSSESGNTKDLDTKDSAGM